jgi:hypothetical protein
MAAWLAICLVAGLAGCSPALDWREVRPEGWALQAMLPCRPATQQRTLSLGGTPVELVMVACAARDHTFALASAALADPAAVGPALQALGAAARANVDGRVLEEGQAAVPGMTPQAAARRWRIQGRLPDGQPVVEEVWVFAHGLRVVQATVVGPSSGVDLVRPFVEALRITP